MRSGDLCMLCLPGEKVSEKIAVAWENSTSGMKDAIVQTSKLLQELYGLKLGDRVTIQRYPEKLQDSARVTLRPTNQLTENEKQAYGTFATATIRQQHDILAPSQHLVIEVGLMKQEFEVVSVGSALGRIVKETEFMIETSDDGSSTAMLVLDLSGVGGLNVQVEQVMTFVDAFTDTEIVQRWPQYQSSRGLLLYGAKGTGKSFLLTAIAAGNWSSIIRWSPGLQIAQDTALRLITIEFEDLALTDSIIREITAMFNVIQGSSTLVVATVRHPNDIPERLRSNGRFETEVELPIPDVDQRLDILKKLRGSALEPYDEVLSALAGRTHGFVGGDLKNLLKRVWVAASGRRKQVSAGELSEKQGLDTNDPFIIDADIQAALQQVRPSALQEIFLEKPNVRWSDIGGQRAIKERLQDAIELPLKYPERMKRLGLVPAKGVLLYGPPGCSKTLTVKALATEADYNFLAVKGAELISMYVGESEKATREVFRKARQASPSIIFFDEIDAIASRGRSGSDLNVLTTLLNEMDGFEELRNVMVVAATNKPESIDPALMRPGRFDSVVYVGPPDSDTRKDIFEKKLANVSVSEDVKERIPDFATQTEGFSGAEIVAVCQSAGWRALKTNQDTISAANILQAITETPKGITPQMLRSYTEWNAQRMR